MMLIDAKGHVRLCGCSGWMPTIIGNILETPLVELLASPLAQSIRQSIIDGTYQYCNEKTCGIIQNGRLSTIDSVPDNIKTLLEDSSKFQLPYEISIHGDLTCNLSCPSCRTHVIKVNEADLEKQNKIGEIIFNNIFGSPTEQQMHLMLSGSGELFASPMLLNFMSKITLDKFPNVSFSIYTNGLLSESRWHRIKHLETAIKKVVVSIDATCAKTYEKIRRGGEWNLLLKNMEFLKNKKQSSNMKLHTRMIVQNGNYSEIPKFYELSKQFDTDLVEYSRLTNWGTWSGKEFVQEDVFNPAHTNYEVAKNLINQVKLKPDVWLEGNFN